MQSALNRDQRIRVFEEFEQRLVMTANAAAELGVSQTIDPQVLVDQIEQQAEVRSLGHIDSQPEVNHVHQEYGFKGGGQTIAVIDSGIAWDHYALGGGYGENHRVVGGWDFAENDGNPYDDGPAGYHGTHVAGIIGSDAENNPGVSPEADLVALRVFDDAGNGNLDWVEDALQWVHEHRNSFQNPITTVNLSLGTSWNSDTVPNWATLEDDFARLEADGIFISVAAGNAYQSYNQNGLSYPAVSEHVVPVASHGPDGQLSDFSQRDDGVLVAPGETIRSTVPDHLFGTNGRDRFLSSTGTSMSAPYVAGASALLREANAFMGNTDIDQDALYDQFKRTADQIYDAASNSYFYRLNLQAAIDSVVTDTAGDSWGNAKQIGWISDGTQLAGTIGSLNDIDVYSFKASTTGTVSLTIDTTHELDAAFTLQNGHASISGNKVTFDVVAGETYKFAIESNGGIGHFDIGVALQNNFASTNLGTVASETFEQQLNGEELFRVTSANDGFFTVRTNSQQPLTVELYDSSFNLISTRSVNSGSARVDGYGQSGDTFYVKLTGQADVEMQIANQVAVQAGQLTVVGSSGDDAIQLSHDDKIQVVVNGMGYQVHAAQVQQVNLSGNQGNDSIQIDLGAANDQVSLRPNIATVSNSAFDLNAIGFESIDVDSGEGANQVTLIDSQNNDVFRVTGDVASLNGNGFSNSVSSFERLVVRSTGGLDAAYLNGTAGNDRFAVNDGDAYLRTNGVFVTATGFDRTYINGRGGNDIVNLTGSQSADDFNLSGRSGSLIANQFRTWVNNISRINAIGGSGDKISFTDTAGDDRFESRQGFASMSGQGYFNWSSGFTEVVATSSAGNDLAQMTDTQANDVLVANTHGARLVSSIQDVRAYGFERVNVVASQGGQDSATLTGTMGDDLLVADTTSVSMRDAYGVTNRAVGFDNVDFDGGAGNDFANLTGSSGDETYDVSEARVKFASAMQELGLENVEASRFDGNGGVDEAIFGDFEELDLLSAVGDKAVAYLEEHSATAIDIDILEARTKSGHDSNYDIAAVDYLYMLRGDWDAV